MVRLEWKNLFKNKILLLVVLAIIAIPTIYTTLFLGSMWDPYGKLEDMPVAVVNLDQPVTYEGKELKVGEELVDNLAENKSLDFYFVTADEAQEGIKEGRYYMVITIPEDFSANAATVMDEEPEKMQLIYETNPGTNYIAMKMSESAMQKIKTSVAEEVTKTYAETIFDQLTDIGDGMQEAADGAGEIQDGVQQLSDGNKEITDNLELLADSTLTFKEGSEELTIGLGDYTKGVVQLQSGAKTLSEGTGTLKAGAGELVAGVSTLNSGALKLKEGTDTYVAGTETLANGTKAFAAGTETLANGTKAFAAGTETLANGTKAFTAGTEILANGTKTYVMGTMTLADGTKKYVGGTSALASGIKTYIAGNEQLKAGMDQLAGLEQIGQVSSGLEQVNQAVNKGSDSTPALKDATASLATGLQTMSQQVNALKDSTDGEQLSQLAGKLGTAVSGIKQAANGIDTASTTVNQTAAGISQAAGLINQTAANVNQTVDADNEKISDFNKAVNDVNSQITKANEEISEQGKNAKSTINNQVDKAIAAIEASVKAGAISSDDADQMIAELKRSKVSESVSGNVSTIKTQDMTLQQISAGTASETLTAVAGNLEDASKGLTVGANTLSQAADSLSEGLKDIPSNIDSTMIDQLASGLQTAAAGAAAINEGINGSSGLANAIDTLTAATSNFPQAAAGVKAIREGMSELAAYNETLTAGADQLLANSDALASGADQLIANSDALASGADQLLANSDTLTSGANQLIASVPTLTAGADQLLANIPALTVGADQLLANADAVTSGMAQVAAGTQTLADSAEPLVDGVAALDDGALKIYDGTTQLADNNEKILSGSAALTDGAGQISDGASKLADGSVELGDGLTELGDGSDELKTALADGADQVNDVNVTDDMLEMIAAPVDTEEVYITEVANNGHAMSAYMMSVALWVGCIAFCIMYPLMKYEGKIRSGFDWWLSKATVLFTIAIGMALVMLGMLHVCNDFNPANWKQMIMVACLASVAFMSIMYFFNVFLGKVGSFLMLIFMVVQLSGAAGTYPIELSGDFVAKIHSWLPFSYTVDAFRVAICGSGSIANAVTVLVGIIVVFTLLTIGLFQIRTKEDRQNRKSLYDMMEERGLA